MTRAKTAQIAQQQPALGDSLRIAIVGAGIAGLSTALALARAGFTHIDVFEAASSFGEIGAGIQVAPNMSAILDRLGVLDKVVKDSVALDGMQIRRCSTNEVLASPSFLHLRDTYRYPQMVCHRADLSKTLFDACISTGVIRIHFSSRLTDLDFENTRFCVTQGEETRWVEVDVVLAADGVKSIARARMLAATGQVDDAEDTGQAAYRVMLTREQIVASGDKELLDLLDSQIAQRWTGHGRMIIAYPIAHHNIYNISTAHPDTHFARAPTGAWTTYGSRAAMLGTYVSYCDTVQRLLALVRRDQVCEWKLRVHAPLDGWVRERVALLGDACHPTLPHLAQGAAQAVEDGAVLAAVLAKVGCKEDVGRALRVYEALRKERAEWVVDAAAHSGKQLLLSDEAALEARDQLFANSHESGRNPDQYADKEVQQRIYGHDCIEEVHTKWDELWAATL
ncbi:FAD/NAD(P)-binding domain-containing protein [Exidia glandulosa HHB12029]|uniref:FAD/NAD(P)-binding domain-containing protein n=1 Tax=Exidia glandulosa HHB12029 TaxID=1314781 RepID=A0A166A1S7_EXIGL|nr:FAD/NAD(P)-binding domain-containing protein [Exidia glandulosa HHB12029]KZV94149.1 FAD/NAD(P)-binding domain-containing protein [Exidia glandulosa HHB12029]